MKVVFDWEENNVMDHRVCWRGCNNVKRLYNPKGNNDFAASDDWIVAAIYGGHGSYDVFSTHFIQADKDRKIIWRYGLHDKMSLVEAKTRIDKALLDAGYKTLPSCMKVLT